MRRYALTVAMLSAACGHPGPELGADDGAGAVDAAGAEAGGSVASRTCESLPPAADYAAPGPFPDVRIEWNVGPGYRYTLFRPGASLGRAGFKHPIATWGNGILTTPDAYRSLLTLIASHGFVIVACNDVQAERACLSAGLDWLIAQNASGAMAGKLDTTREVTIGYSWGGGAAIDAADRPNVKATVSLHGMPPRQASALETARGPLLMLTSTGDTFVTRDAYVTPTFEKARVPAVEATLCDATVGHLYVVDRNAIACLVAPLLGACGGAALERGPTVAWLRVHACGDRAARRYFYGADCGLCEQPWAARKRNWPVPDAP